MKLEKSRVWIVGAYGRVGSAVSTLLSEMDVEILKTDIDDVDITNAEDVNIYADIRRPDVIINCAGMTDLMACERKREQAFKVNAIGPRNLSTAARKINARLVQISTDDVFDGKANAPYNEFDQTNPISMYGKSKLAGENFVRELTPKHMIIRSSWLYGEGDSFLNSILERARTEKTIPVSTHQFASPTSAKELAKTILQILNNGEDGVYHAVCSGYCSRYEFAKEIVRLAGLDTDIVPTSETDESSGNMRPSYSVLDNLMLRICSIEEPVQWKTALEEYFRK